MRARHTIRIVLATAILLLVVGTTIESRRGPVEYGPMARLLPSNGEIYQWIKDLWGLGDRTAIGFRQPGSAGDHEAARYIHDRFLEFGIADTRLQTVDGWTLWTPGTSALTVHAGGLPVQVPCSYRPYTAFTDAAGVTAGLAYVGTGMTASDFAGAAGKIVLVDLVAPGLDADALLPFSPFTYDPGDTLPGRKVTQNWPVGNLVASYDNAVAHGAVGYIGILAPLAGDMTQYYSPYTGVLTTLPGLYVSEETGASLKARLAAGAVDATLVLRGTTDPGITYNVIATLPGVSDEVILVTSHHDGWAANEGSGASIVMALAQYFAKLPPGSRQRTLVFHAAGGHFLGDVPTKAFIAAHPELMAKTVASLSIEMIGKEYIEVNGRFEPTGLVSPRAMFISGPRFQVNGTLLAFAEEAITTYDLVRTTVLPANGPLGPAPPGVAGYYFRLGIPIVHLISAPAHQFTPDDTPNKVAVDQLRPVTAAYAHLVQQIDVTPADALKN